VHVCLGGTPPGRAVKMYWDDIRLRNLGATRASRWRSTQQAPEYLPSVQEGHPHGEPHHTTNMAMTVSGYYNIGKARWLLLAAPPLLPETELARRGQGLASPTSAKQPGQYKLR